MPTSSGRSTSCDETAALGWTPEDLRRAGLTALREIYTSHGFAEAERRHVFGDCWTLVADAETIGPGRYVCLDVAGAPIVVWRGEDGLCRAWHNLCRHRGIPVLEGEGRLSRYVTCPYHQWSYSLEGELVRVPQADQFPDADRASLGLLPVPVAEWHGMVFVCLTPDPPPFAEEIAFLEEKVAAHLTLPLVEVARVDYRVACNWKLLVENHVDVYHLWYLHQHSLSDSDHGAFRWEWHGSLWWSSEPLKDPAGYVPGLPGLGEQAADIGAHLLWPNLMIVTTGDYLATYDARPAGPGYTDLTLRIRALPGSDGAALVASVRRFLGEDIAACEAMQRAASSPAFSIGPTARTHEEPVRIFHRALRDRVLP